MELILFITFVDAKTFSVFRQLRSADTLARDDVLKLDYKYTPWPRWNGNLLW